MMIEICCRLSDAQHKGNLVLDGARGDKADGPRAHRRHLVSRLHHHRDGHGQTALVSVLLSGELHIDSSGFFLKHVAGSVTVREKLSAGLGGTVLFDEKMFNRASSCMRPSLASSALKPSLVSSAFPGFLCSIYFGNHHTGRDPCFSYSKQVGECMLLRGSSKRALPHPRTILTTWKTSEMVHVY